MRIVRIIAIVALAALSFAAIAKDCETCGGTLTDKGVCPYCQPKPKVLGQ